MRDLLIVGAGPAGMTAAIHAASEGLDVEVWEQTDRVGGAAGQSCRIDNLPGFPAGISGPELAERMADQVRRFGAKFKFGTRMGQHHGMDGSDLRMVTSDLETPYGPYKRKTRALFLATGKPVGGSLGVEGDDQPHVHYRTTDADLPVGSTVAVIGGGNAAGQAAVGLAERGTHVHLFTRHDLSGMSWYLAEQIERDRHITRHLFATVSAISDHAIFWRTEQGLTYGQPVDAVFVFTGTDDPLGQPAPIPGVWIIGDAQPGAVQRIPAAMGSAAAAVQELHTYLRKDTV